jgi:hypothetical protein
MLNKIPLYLLLLLSLFAQGQAVVQDTAVTDSVAFIDDFKPSKSITALPADTVVVYNKREFSPGFKSRYKGAEFQYETKAKSKTMWERFMAWLARMLDGIFAVGDGAQKTSAFTMIMRVIAILVVALVVYMIVRAILNKDGWIFGRSGKKIIVNDVTEENINQMNFPELILQTKETGDYRLGIRYYYLWLLKKLYGREIIKWHWDKTNTDYLYEIKDAGLRKDFEYLSYLYDHSWYGEFPIDEIAFGKAEKAFRKTLNTL